jgi:NAD+-dependent protein deacetylase sirtuin 4
MSKPLMRIPFSTGTLPPPLIVPSTATTVEGAISALTHFLQPFKDAALPKTVLLTGAGISVASGLADYRGKGGTYSSNPNYRPVYYHEFLASHAWRKRYWARSFLGYPSLLRSKPNSTHRAIGALHSLGAISTCITQNVDSFHPKAHPNLPTIELHGYLRALLCLSCGTLHPRDKFQDSLAALNPAWKVFLEELLATGALSTEDPREREKLGYRTNPDGDADVPGAPYTTFRYPPCPKCLDQPPILKDGSKAQVLVDDDGAWSERSNGGILKPNVIMFGESIPAHVKVAAEEAIDDAERMLVVGTSLATYSAWRLAKQAFDRGIPIGVLNLGGVRKEETFFTPEAREQWDRKGDRGQSAFRASWASEDVLPSVVERLTQQLD